jgi:transposase
MGWLVAGVVPVVERQPLKKLKPELDRLLEVLQRWGSEAGRSGRKITRIVVAYEAGRDGFWLARTLKAHGIEAHVIHPASVAVSREHRRAKTDRLDTELLKRAFIGWLRGERQISRIRFFTDKVRSRQHSRSRLACAAPPDAASRISASG